ncbi:MAG: epoxyqueuosine reductase QueH [Deltaproteobacteria bacterium]|nr:epoxyqueuosine reductase QueH [Deltaproteobacteria bacterium]
MSSNRTRILLHMCCAPCTTYPLQQLRGNWERVIGFYYNPNIHPYREYEKRLSAVRQLAETTGLEVIYRDEYDLENFIRSVVYREQNRCQYCYHRRLEAAARMAAKSKFHAFTSTLLYSRLQKHDLIAEMGESLGKKWGVPFHYEDFRKGWKEGIALAKEMSLYRQPYCGCIYSEKDRFYPATGQKREAE